MENTNPNQNISADVEDNDEVNEKMHQTSLLNMLLIFALLGFVFYGLFLTFDKGRVISATDQAETEIKSLQTEIDALKENKVEVSQTAIDALKDVETEEILWSEVIAEVNNLLPQDARGDRKVDVLSYSGSGEGRIALNVVTKPTALPAYGDVAQMIATFNNSVFFKDVYVPSISKGSGDTGSVTLSFVLNMDYQKLSTGSENLELMEDNSAAKIPATRTDESTRVPRSN